MTRLLTICCACVLLSCGPSAQKRAAADYVSAMTPLLQDNTKLSRAFLDLAAQVKKQRTLPQEVADQLETDFIPAARSLRDGASAIAPETSPLGGIHMGLVRAWTNRVSAYEGMHKAWASGDLADFEGVAVDHQTVFKAEARYFDSVNTTLGEHGLSLSQYP